MRWKCNGHTLAGSPSSSLSTQTILRGQCRRRLEENGGHGRHPNHADQGGRARASPRLYFPLLTACLCSQGLTVSSRMPMVIDFCFAGGAARLVTTHGGDRK